MTQEKMDESDGGGVGAKKGFLYQDLAAALYLSQMLFDKKLKKIRCEVTDDIDLVYEEYTEFVQVKTTKSEKSWTLDELSKESEKNKQDSILHKSLECDKTANLLSRFRILTPRGVNAKLCFLSIERHKREDKSGRDDIILSIQKKLKKYTSANGNAAEYWVDNFWWEIIGSEKELELLLLSNIRRSAIDRNVYLNPREEFQIMCSMVYTLNKKSAVSRKLKTIDDKSYSREDFITWFEDELKFVPADGRSYKKIYPTKFDNTFSILQEMEETYYCDKMKLLQGKLFYQTYNRGNYNFKHIANSIYNWLPEVLLSPDELDTINGFSFYETFQRFSSKIDFEDKELDSLTARTMLHSIIRTKKHSQPIISAEIYSARNIYDNVHIVIKNHEPDELWIGFNCIIRDDNIMAAFEGSLSLLLNFIDDFAIHKKVILNAKKDPYLLKHDINEILNSSETFDSLMGRINIVLFFGYKTAAQPLVYDASRDQSYIENMMEEVKNHILNMSAVMQKEKFLNNINANLFVFPAPCVDTMISNIKSGIYKVDSHE